MTVQKMFVKRFLILTLYALLLVLLNSLAYGAWVSEDPPHIYGPTGPPNEDWNLFGVHFPSPTEGVAVGSDTANNGAVLLAYSNGTWIKLNTPTLYQGSEKDPYLLTGVHHVFWIERPLDSPHHVECDLGVLEV